MRHCKAVQQHGSMVTHPVASHLTLVQQLPLFLPNQQCLGSRHCSPQLHTLVYSPTW